MQAEDVAIADADGDGHADIVVAAELAHLIYSKNPGHNPHVPWARHDIVRRKRAMYDKWLARDLDGDGDLDMVGTRGNSYPFDGVIWLEQVRTADPKAVFKAARLTDCAEMPVAPASAGMPESMLPEDHLPIRREE